MKLSLTGEEKKNISVDELARLILRIGGEVIAPPALLEKLSAENNRSIQLSDQPQEFFLKFYEAIALLGRRGFLMDVMESRPAVRYRRHFRRTSIWEKVSADEMIILIDDAHKIVNLLEEKIPRLDPVVKQYYLQSLRACQERLYIASVICLGAASERAVDCLVQAVISRCPNHSDAIEGLRYISAQINYLSEKTNFGQIFGSIGDNIFRNELKDKLSGIAHIYRRNRNEAGHPGPIPMDITRAEQECYLSSFERYVVVIFKAIQFLESNSP